MTPQQLVEIVRDSFPDKPVTYVEIELLNALKDYCNRTSILKSSVSLTATDFSISTTVPNTLKYTVGSSVNAISEIELFDENGLRATTGLRYTLTSDRELKIFDKDGECITTFPSGIKTIGIWYVSIPSALSDVSSVPDQYHFALTEKVLSKFCRSAKDYRGYQIANMEYEKAVVQGIKYANKKIQTGNYQFRKDEF